jgi:hypothetical protein
MEGEREVVRRGREGGGQDRERGRWPGEGEREVVRRISPDLRLNA